MKKAKIILPMMLAGLLVACGESNSTKDPSGSSANNPVVTHEVTAEQWEQALSDVNNFTMEMSMTTMNLIVKVDGVKRLQQMGEEMEIVTIEDENYFGYFFSEDVWTKYSIEERNYQYSESYARFLTMLKDDYDSFTYENEVYTAEILDKTDTLGGELDNVVVSFTNEKLTGITFEINEIDDGEEIHNSYEVKDVGTTSIEIPTTYIDKTSNADISVGGKSFVFYDLVCEAWDEVQLEQTKAYNQGMTMSFGNDGDVAITQMQGSVIQLGNYTQDGENVVITIISMTMNGVPIDAGNGVIVNCTYDGEYLVIVDEIDGDTMTTYFIEQA